MGTEAPVIVGEVPSVSLEAIAQEMQAISALSPEARKDAIEAILKDQKKRASVLAFQAARRQSEQTALDAQAQQGWAGWAANGVVSAVSSAASVVGLTRPAPTTANGSFAADSLTDDLTLTLSMVSTNDDLPAITSPTPDFLGASQVLSFVDPSSLELRLAEAHAVEATENTPIPPIDSPPQPSEALIATMDDSVIVDLAEANSDFDSGDESLGEDDGPPPQKRDADQAGEAAEALRAQEAQQRAAEIEAASREEQTRREAEKVAALQRAEEATRVEKARRDAEEAAKQKALLEKQEALKKQQEEADAQRKAKQTAQNAAHAHKEKPEAGATTSKVDSVRTFFAFPPSVTTAAPQQPKVKQPPAAAPKVTPLVSQQPKSAQQAAQQSVFLAQKQKQEDDQKAAALALKLKQEEQEQKQAAALEAAAERRRFENDLRHRANMMGL